MSQFDFSIQILTLWTVLLTPPQFLSLAIHLVYCLVSKEITSFKILLLAILFLSEMELKQKFAMCWTLLHFCLLKMPGLSKSPGGGKIAFDFMVRMLTGTYGTGLFTSLIASTIHGHELNIASHSTIKVCKDSISKLVMIVKQTIKYCFSRTSLFFPNPTKVTCNWWIVLPDYPICTL